MMEKKKTTRKTTKTQRLKKAAPKKEKAAGPLIDQTAVSPEPSVVESSRSSVERSAADEGRLSARERYFESVGRRKTAIARVRLFTKAGDFTVNGRPHNVYFPYELQKIAEEALQKMKLWGRFKVTVQIKGGGLHSQAEALRHGLSRCLVKFNPDFRKRLRRADFLKRDPRAKERKKPGLKRARKAPQWSKR